MVGRKEYRGWTEGIPWLDGRNTVVGRKRISNKPFIYNTLVTTDQPQSILEYLR